MYAVRIAYPNAGNSFNLDHYLQVHSPLGLGLLWTERGVKPARIEIDVEPAALAQNEPPSYLCATNLYFSTLEEVNAFRSLFADPAISQRLKADFPNYTALPPVISVSKILSLDPETYAADPN